MFIEIDEDPIIGSTQLDSLWLFCNKIVGEVKKYAKLFKSEGLIVAEFTDECEGTPEKLITKTLLNSLYEKS